MKRESGSIPERAHRCTRGQIPHNRHCFDLEVGRRGKRLIRKSEDLPEQHPDLAGMQGRDTDSSGTKRDILDHDDNGPGFFFWPGPRRLLTIHPATRFFSVSWCFGEWNHLHRVTLPGSTLDSATKRQRKRTVSGWVLLNRLPKTPRSTRCNRRRQLFSPCSEPQWRQL